jgi:hypothetical protein
VESTHLWPTICQKLTARSCEPDTNKVHPIDDVYPKTKSQRRSLAAKCIHGKYAEAYSPNIACSAIDPFANLATNRRLAVSATQPESWNGKRGARENFFQM